MVEHIQHIEDSILNATNGKSKLTSDILAIDGMSSSSNRHLLNNLVDIPDINYLEIGVWKGSTFISALYQNNVSSAYAIDDWSQFMEYDLKGCFLNNCNNFNINYKLIEDNCFAVDLSNIKSKIDVFFYDGNHDRKLTRNAIVYYYNVLADEFMYIIDDYDWDDVNYGVDDAIVKMGLDVIYKKHLHSNGMNDTETWWNGIGIFIFRKK